MTTGVLVDIVSNRNIPIDGGNNVHNALLANILIELRVHTLYLQALASGQQLTDDPVQLRADQVSDPTLIYQTQP